jgi:undecaprenyl diphosphate synthase
VPRHVAIIMDGNGRWANARKLPRSAGHKVGVEALRRAIRAAADFGIEYLTIYSFSSENWSRPPAEVRFLLELLRRFIHQDVAELHRAGVKITVIGGRDDLEPSIVSMLEEAERITRDNTKLKLIVAFNYGSRQEITRAVRKIAAAARDGALDPASITPEDVTLALDAPGIPDPDLLIRTGGEQRISNFLLWQSAYTEFVFVPEYWPDFDSAVFARALQEYRARDRRFGGIKAQSA